MSASLSSAKARTRSNHVVEEAFTSTSLGGVKRQDSRRGSFVTHHETQADMRCTASSTVHRVRLDYSKQITTLRRVIPLSLVSSPSNDRCRCNPHAIQLTGRDRSAFDAWCDLRNLLRCPSNISRSRRSTVLGSERRQSGQHVVGLSSLGVVDVDEAPGHDSVGVEHEGRGKR